MDKYDAEIERLKNATQDEIAESWNECEPLFKRCCRFGELRRDYIPCGCLTQIRLGKHVAATDALTLEIRADDRIPREPHLITPAHLPIFAEWQRRIDKELNRRD